jgi:hypothetical protein
VASIQTRVPGNKHLLASICLWRDPEE